MSGLSTTMVEILHRGSAYHVGVCPVTCPITSHTLTLGCKLIYPALFGKTYLSGMLSGGGLWPSGVAIGSVCVWQTVLAKLLYPIVYFFLNFIDS